LISALHYAGEDSSRYLLASDLTWRTLDLVQGDPLRWLVEVVVPDWKSPAGGKQLTKQPGHEEACRSVILSLLGDHCLFLHPDQHAHRRTNLPAYPVGRLRANVQVACLVDVIQHRIASEDPQSQLQRFTQALREVFAFSRSTTPLIQRQLGRLEPTPYLQYRADEVMRNVQLLST
jgi:hypothetical protein